MITSIERVRPRHLVRIERQQESGNCIGDQGAEEFAGQCQAGCVSVAEPVDQGTKQWQVDVPHMRPARELL